MIFCIREQETSCGETINEAFDNMCELSHYVSLSDCVFYEGEEFKVGLKKIEEE